MKQKLFCSAFLFFPVFALSQKTALKVSPYVDVVTNISNGQIEAGPELQWKNNLKGKSFYLRPAIQMPLTSGAENILQIDRFTATWRGILNLQYIIDNTKESGNISRNSLVVQFEYGSTPFKYYPTAATNDQRQKTGNSYGGELQYIGFFTKGKSGAMQVSPQVRLKYSFDWAAAAAVGVVNAPNSNGVVTTTNIILSPPSATPLFSPAFSLQLYPGKGSFSYSPSLFYDFAGQDGSNDPFGNLGRLRIESWVFYYPSVVGNPNIKIGISPFLSLRTAGTDSYNKVEYGGVVTFKIGTTFLQFF